jgi:Family of unknown function (DUF6188)
MSDDDFRFEFAAGAAIRARSDGDGVELTFVGAEGEGELAISSVSEVLVRVCDEVRRLSANEVARSVNGLTVVDLVAGDAGDLRLVASGDVVVSVEPSETFESWELVGRGSKSEIRALVLPGGGLQIWEKGVGR